MGNTQAALKRHPTGIVRAASDSNLLSSTQTDDERIQSSTLRSTLEGIPEDWLAQIESAVRRWEDRLSIQLPGRRLTSLPAWIALDRHRELVAEIDLKENRLREFPLELLRFPRLERLGLGSNELAGIPDEIGQLRHLTWLDFTHNRIGHVSEAIGGLPRLVSLGASDCRLTQFPLAFTRLKRLRKLGCFNNLLTCLPPEIGNLTCLTKLDLSGNGLTTLPPEIGHLRALTWLNVSNNRLEHLPPELGQLTALRELGLANNRLRELPDLRCLTLLTLLTAFNNELEGMGDWLEQLVSLVRLDLSSNRLDRLPDGLLRLPSLQLLNVRNNRLSHLAPPDPRDGHQRPSALQVLDVRDNQLVSLPVGVLGADTLLIGGNPLLRTPALPLVPTIPPLHMAALAEAFALYDLPGARKALIRSLTPSLAHRCEEVWGGRAGWTCYHCRGTFVHAPLRLIDLVPSSDDHLIPCIVQVCSIRCHTSFLAGDNMVTTVSTKIEYNDSRMMMVTEREQHQPY